MSELRQSIFPLVVLAYIAFLVAINALMFLPYFGWLPENVLSAMGHFGSFLETGDTHNLVHELVFAFIVGTGAVGLIQQLRKPRENFAGQLIAIIAWGVMIVTALITNNWVPQPLFIIFGGLTLLATLLHPAGRNLFRWMKGAQWNRTLLILTLIAAAPLAAFAFKNIGLQVAGSSGASLFRHEIPAMHGAPNTVHAEKHAIEGHYRNLAAFSFMIILTGLLASLRPPGEQFTAAVAGGLPILLGIASIALPDAESSLGVGWGLVAILWGTAFIIAAELTKNK